jgi:hypothetical protein
MSSPLSLYHIFAQCKPLTYPRTLFHPLARWLTIKKIVWIGLHEFDTFLSQKYFIFLRVVMYGYLKDYLLMDHTCRMTTIKEGLHHKLENMVSSFFIISIVL